LECVIGMGTSGDTRSTSTSCRWSAARPWDEAWTGMVANGRDDAAGNHRVRVRGVGRLGGMGLWVETEPVGECSYKFP
jgi:hypothetical protein